MCVIVIR